MVPAVAAGTAGRTDPAVPAGGTIAAARRGAGSASVLDVAAGTAGRTDPAVPAGGTIAAARRGAGSASVLDGATGAAVANQQPACTPVTT